MPRLRLLLALPLTVIALLAIVVALVGLSRDDGPAAVPRVALRGAVRPASLPIRAFTLRDERGRDIHLANLQGRPVAVLFACTRCANGPLAAQQVRAALDAVPAAAAVAVSTDAAGDTRARRDRFLAASGLRGRVPFLSGSPAALRRVWRDYGTGARGVGVVVLDAAGRQRESFSVETLTPENLTHDLRALS